MNPIGYCWNCGEIIPVENDSPDTRYCSRECCLEDHDEHEDREPRSADEPWGQL